MDANFGQPRLSNRIHSPHQLDREVVKKIKLGLGIDNNQPVWLSHLRGNFREVLGACHADRDWKAELCAHTTTYCSRDLKRRTEKVGAPRDVSKGLIDGNPLDERSEIIEHIDGSIAQPLVILEMPAAKISCGHSSRARRPDIPLLTPNDLASYEAASTTPPPTAMGLPRKDGTSSCSTDA